jgi:hypothetical protein
MNTVINPSTFVVLPGSLREFTINMFSNAQKAAKEKIHRFSDDMLKTPGDALKQADSVFAATAQVTVIGLVIDMLRNGCSYQDIVDTLNDALRHRACLLPNYSSTSSNFCTRCEISALVAALYELKFAEGMQC